MRLQLSKVDQRKSLKRRAGLAVFSAAACAAAISVAVIAHLGWRRHGCVGPLKKLDTITGESILTAG
jgi:hypothetical protein